ncbi:MAG: hypothetical protein KJZ80_12185 [Hyphomicrobiaceae bacterium]|nr:hypothetical protein [Hyphomicrobiaceae bacterium]
MILRKVIREKVVEYFESDHWRGFLSVLSRGRVVRHAHLYCEGILHPESIRQVARNYFETRNLPLERQVKILSHGPGYANVYYIQPKGMCHFEIFSKFNSDVVMEPMSAQAARGGKTMEYWDDAFMAEHYKQFDFRSMGERERKEVRDYFQGDAWRAIYAVMAYENENNLHSHCIVETSLSPEDILPLGQEAIEARGWKIDRAISVVFGVNGLDQGKITYLLSKPEIVLELEWEHNRAVTIRPAAPAPARIMTAEAMHRDTASVPYVRLNDDDIQWISARFQSARDK